jgi:hypothetical protein
VPPPPNPHHNPETSGAGSILEEFVDVYTGPPTPEQLARPRYRRSVQAPRDQASTSGEGTLVEFTDEGPQHNQGNSGPAQAGPPNPA